MMADTLHFSKSPLTEAIIDIRVAQRDTLALEALAELQKGQEAAYPTRRDRLFVEGMFSTNPQDPPAEGKRTHLGYDFVNADERQFVQVRLDGFTFSRLAPYENWETFSAEARRWWDIYRQITQPEAVTRLAVRYINRLDLPLPVGDLRDYLRTLPDISPSLPQGLSGYFMQLQIPQEDITAMLILNEALIPPPTPDVASVLLDIDIFRDTDVPTDETEMWLYFETLRKRKNDVFLACITDTVKEFIA